MVKSDIVGNKRRMNLKDRSNDTDSPPNDSFQTLEPP